MTEPILIPPPKVTDQDAEQWRLDALHVINGVGEMAGLKKYANSCQALMELYTLQAERILALLNERQMTKEHK